MKLTINSKDLLKAIQIVGGLIKPQNTIPVLDNILFRASGDVLKLTADNLEVRSSIDVPAVSDKEFQVCVPYAALSNILKGFAQMPLDLVFTKNSVTIKSTTGDYKLPTVDAKEFPLNDFEEPSSNMVINSLDFVEGLKKAAPFASANDMTSLGSVLVWFDEECTRFVGCSHFVFFEYSVPVKGNNTKALISRASATYLTSSITTEEDLTVSFAGSHMFLNLEGREISVLLSAEKYADYQKIFSMITTDKAYKADLSMLLPAVKRLLSISNSAIKYLGFNFNGNTLELSYNNDMQQMSSKEVLDCEYQGEPLSIGLNASHIQTILNVFGSDDVEMKFSIENKPCLIVGENARCLAMPMMLPKVNEGSAA